jgi:vacuolar-type H+-ATPase subunit H/phage tail protein X
MGQEPSQIRQEIEETRAEMGDTVDALAYKTDVKTRVKESISDKRERLIEQVQGTTHKVGEATPDGSQVKEGAQQAVGVAQENPLGLTIGGLAAGFLAGMMLPSSRVEDEKVGPIADQVKETAAETGQEALERGREVASQVAEQAVEGAKEVGQQAMDSAKEVGQETVDSAKEAGQEQADELKDSAKEGAQEVKEQARSNSPSTS